MLNHCEIMGRLTADPELKRTVNGTAVTSFTLANNTGYKRADGSEITHFIDCVAWRHTAEFITKYLTKGCRIVVEGEITPRNYDDKNGVHHKVTEITVSRVDPADGKKEKAEGRTEEQEAPPVKEPISDDGDLPF